MKYVLLFTGVVTLSYKYYFVKERNVENLSNLKVVPYEHHGFCVRRKYFPWSSLFQKRKSCVLDNLKDLIKESDLEDT